MPARLLAFTLELNSLAGLVMLVLLSVSPVWGQSPDRTVEVNEVPETEVDDSESDGSIDDAEGSLQDAVEKRGVSVTGDLRLAYSNFDLDRQDVNSEDEDAFRMRWRFEGTWGITERLRTVTRVAGICSTEECDPDWYLEPEIPTPVGLEDGQITLDQFFFHWFRSDRFDLAVGRLQTKFVARGGVYAKSLDRNDSNNLRVNWTDGFHGTLRSDGGWVSHLILQYNASDGASNIRRRPLDFSDSDSRFTYFLAFENLEREGFWVQRGLDISYLPSSLLEDGTLNGPVEDYWGIVGRAAVRWPQTGQGPRLRFSTELGYAPETQSKAAAGLAGEGDVDGWAWNFTASIIDIYPNHSVGINYGRTDPGWLLSPQYENNEQLFEIRYRWLRSRRLAIDVRGRWLEDLDQRVGERKRDEFDFYLRFTWGFTARHF